MRGLTKKFKSAWSALITCLWIVMACGSPKQDPSIEQEPTKPEPEPIGNEQPIPPYSNINCPNGTYLTYENFGGAFLSTYCTSCHHSSLSEGERYDAPLTSNFDSAYLAQVWRAEILMHVAGETPTMPPNRFVTTEEQREFSEWLNCGAPEK